MHNLSFFGQKEKLYNHLLYLANIDLNFASFFLFSRAHQRIPQLSMPSMTTNIWLVSNYLGIQLDASLSNILQLDSKHAVWIPSNKKTMLRPQTLLEMHFYMFLIFFPIASIWDCFADILGKSRTQKVKSEKWLTLKLLIYAAVRVTYSLLHKLHTEYT